MTSNWILDKNGIHIPQLSDEKISYPEEGNDFCFAVEDNSDWFKYRNDLILYFLKKYNVTGDFLDIGGGNGFQIQAIEDANLISGNSILIEPGYSGCLNAKKRNCKLIINGFFQNFDFSKFHVTNYGLFDVIEHIEDDIQFLNELYDIIPKNSRIFINVPARMKYWSQTDLFAGHYRRYENSDLNRITSLTKFKLVDSSCYFNFYIIPLFILRILPEKLGFKKSEDELIAAETRNLTAVTKKSLLNSVFSTLHSISMKKIQRGNRIKNGTSLFFVLEK